MIGNREAACLPGGVCPAGETAPAAKKTNVLWIYLEDISPWLPAWGDATVATPHIDRLAARGTVFPSCYSVAPVCSPARSAVITGFYPTKIGAHQHVSSRPGEPAINLPDTVRTLPEIFREAGYFTYNLGKDDYNFAYDRGALYDGPYETLKFFGHCHKGYLPFDTEEREWAYWRRRKPGQPFFGQIGLWGGKNTRLAPAPVDPTSVSVPPYYPDTPAFRQEIARHYECLQIVDAEVGKILDALEADGLLDSTAVFLFSDHGAGLLRHKQFCYDGGTHIPLLIASHHFPRGKRDDRLVSSIDISATTLAVAGLSAPEGMDGRSLLPGTPARDKVFSARDRCDFTIDRIRSVRTNRFKYIRNFLTDRPLMQPQYRDQTACFLEYRRLFQQGKLSPVQAFFAGDQRVPEELYDLAADPHETLNLADDTRHAATLAEMRAALEGWIVETNDQGRLPDSDQQLRALLARWGARCVNPEYDRVRLPEPQG